MLPQYNQNGQKLVWQIPAVIEVEVCFNVELSVLIISCEVASFVGGSHSGEIALATGSDETLNIFINEVHWLIVK